MFINPTTTAGAIGHGEVRVVVVAGGGVEPLVPVRAVVGLEHLHLCVVNVTRHAQQPPLCA